MKVLFKCTNKTTRIPIFHIVSFEYSNISNFLLAIMKVAKKWYIIGGLYSHFGIYSNSKEDINSTLTLMCWMFFFFLLSFCSLFIMVTFIFLWWYWSTVVKIIDVSFLQFSSMFLKIYPVQTQAIGSNQKKKRHVKQFGLIIS